jgi:abortive infection bacteriophage resistance protein
MPINQPVKPHTDFRKQLEILKGRGLIIDDEAKALGYLQTIGYYRLSGYLYVFRQRDNTGGRKDNFISGSHFQSVIDLYMFDKNLRHLALDALERIEVAMRVQIVYILGAYDPLAHLDAQYFDSSFDHAFWLKNYQKMVSREESKSDFIQHHRKKYGALPIWAGCEVWDFGTMSKLYQGMRSADKDKIAHYFGLPGAKQLETQLRTFNFIRNVSAHYGRLWNRYVAYKASTKGLPCSWQSLPKDRSFIYFCLMNRMLQVICSNTQWGVRFIEILNSFPITDNPAVGLKEFGLTVDLDTVKTQIMLIKS